MTPNRRTAADPLGERTTRLLDRRRLLALTGSAGAALLAGCSGDGGTDDPAGDTVGGNGSDDERTATVTESEETGTFRLLISDQPVAIDEFDSLEVSLDRARIFRSGSEGGDEDAEEAEEETEAETLSPTATATPAGNETATDDETTTSTATADAEADGDGSEEDESDEDEAGDESEAKDGNGKNGGFSVVDLDGATVDLTKVLGDKALSVFEGGLPAGRYTKIELHAAEVGGVVDGEAVDVKLPSEKLQITKPFEVTAGETLSFVFDITVVKKGNGGYNLKPVISESGVAGKDVPVEEVDEDGDEEDSENAESDDEGGNEETGGADAGEDGKNDENGDDGQPVDGTPTSADA